MIHFPVGIIYENLPALTILWLFELVSLNIFLIVEQ